MVFPLHDDNTQVRIVPGITWGLIALNVFVYLFWEMPQTTMQLQQSFFRYGVVPMEYALAMDLPPFVPFPYWYTLMTMMFIHGGLAHLLGNMLYLWIFGDNVEQAFGHTRFLLFYLICGLGASLTHIFFNSDSFIPSVGASGAISGVLAAYLILFPRQKVVMASIYGIFTLSAAVLIGIWIGLQVVYAMAQIAAGDPGTGIAYMAHLGGFIVGIPLTLFLLFAQRFDRSDLASNKE